MEHIRIIESSLEPLSSIGVGGILVEVGKVTTETSDSLTAHGVSLVRHSRGSNLVLLEWFLHFLGRSEMSDITSNTLDGSTQTREGIGNSEVYLSGVGLSADIVAFWEAGLLAKEGVQFINLLSIAVEDLHERGWEMG